MKKLFMIVFVAVMLCGTVGVVRAEIKLSASDGQEGDLFATSSSISGDWAIFGAYGDDDFGGRSGSAYMFHYDGTNWTEHSKLLASDGDAGDYFGYSVSISGDWAVVGAVYEEENGYRSGSAYMFHYDGTNWVETTKLFASDGEWTDHFGHTVSISGDWVLIGAYGSEEPDENSGAAYMFHYNGTDWVEYAKLVPDDADINDRFGSSVSISGDWAIIGAHYDDSIKSLGGAAYMFHLVGTNWVQHSKITASDLSTSNTFGRAVSISGGWAIAASYNAYGTGSAYVFNYDGTDWVENSKLEAKDGEMNDYFGRSVAITDGWALVGAYRVDSPEEQAGAGYLFSYNGTRWSQEAKLSAQDGEAFEYLGITVSISGGHAIVGSHSVEVLAPNDGAAYVFEYTPIDDQATVIFRPGRLRLASKQESIKCIVKLPVYYNLSAVDCSTVRLWVDGESVPATECVVKGGALVVKFNRAAVVDLLPPANEVELIVTGEEGVEYFEGGEYVKVVRGK